MTAHDPSSPTVDGYRRRPCAAILSVLWGVLACALGGPVAGEAAEPGTAGPPEDTRFGLDAHAHVHAGSEAFLTGAGPETEAPALWRLAALGSTEARAYRLVARLGLALSAQGHSPRADRSAANEPVRYYHVALSECSLRLRFGAAEAEDGILLGLARLQGNPDAILFGGYLARFGAYPAIETRRAPEWDSLGGPAPRVFGMRLAIGRRDGPARIEGWVVREEDGSSLLREYSLFAFLSGRAPRKIDWGLGWSVLRAFDLGDGLAAPGRTARRYDTDDSTGVIVTSPSGGDTAWYTMSAPDRFSARLSLDFAALFGLDGTEGRYGGLFGEAALLGWKNYPYYYTDRAKRFAWTVGARLPTRGWPDMCVIQFEWRHEAEYGLGYYQASLAAAPVPVMSGSAVPAGYPDNPPRRPSPARLGLFLAERIGRAFEAQARFLAYETAAGGYPAGKRMRALGRIVYRLP